MVFITLLHMQIIYPLWILEWNVRFCWLSVYFVYSYGDLFKNDQWSFNFFTPIYLLFQDSLKLLINYGYFIQICCWKELKLF